MTLEDLRSTRAQSGYLGVSPSKSVPRPWMASIWNRQYQRTVYLGCFRTIEQAAKRVLRAFKQLDRSPHEKRKWKYCKYGHLFLKRRTWRSKDRTVDRCDTCIRQKNREYSQIRRLRKLEMREAA